MGYTVHHPPCGKTWTGLRPEHCTVCHETFSSTRAGDLHRRGPMTARLCMEPGSVGLVLDAVRGIWRLPGQRPEEVTP